MEGGETPILRVTALQDKRRRAGKLFTREARLLMPIEFEQSLAGVAAVLAIVSDPQLACELVDDEGDITPLSTEMVDELRVNYAAACGANKDAPATQELIEQLLGSDVDAEEAKKVADALAGIEAAKLAADEVEAKALAKVDADAKAAAEAKAKADAKPKPAKKPAKSKPDVLPVQSGSDAGENAKA